MKADNSDSLFSINQQNQTSKKKTDRLFFTNT